jgi:hypothetical protein
MAFGHAVEGFQLAVARIVNDVGRADDLLAGKGRLEDQRVVRHRQVREAVARDAGDGVQRVALARLVGDIVEEGAIFGATEFGGRIGDHLDQPVLVEVA